MQKLINILLDIINNDSKRIELIKKFQEEIWNISNEEEPGNILEILRDLAYDLDFYEPDPSKRNESISYFGDDRLQEEIRSSLKKIEKLRKS